MLSAALVTLILVVVIEIVSSSPSEPPSLYRGQPSILARFNLELTGLSNTRVEIVKLAESQIGYKTNPVDSYCNKYSAFWYSGASGCPNGELDEEWCADFAAWVWRSAGIPFSYRYQNGYINSSSASFYEWGRRHGTWHATGSGYVPRPGDVAVYGLNVATLVAAHVAIVVGSSGANNAPAAVNGDADHKSFSDVEFVTNELHPDAKNPGVTLSGYVSPLP